MLLRMLYIAPNIDISDLSDVKHYESSSESSKCSLVKDFANPNDEPMDYTGGDD